MSAHVLELLACVALAGSLGFRIGARFGFARGATFAAAAYPVRRWELEERQRAQQRYTEWFASVRRIRL